MTEREWMPGGFLKMAASTQGVQQEGAEPRVEILESCSRGEFRAMYMHFLQKEEVLLLRSSDVVCRGEGVREDRADMPWSLTSHPLNKQCSRK